MVNESTHRHRRRARAWLLVRPACVLFAIVGIVMVGQAEARTIPPGHADEPQGSYDAAALIRALTLNGYENVVVAVTTEEAERTLLLAFEYRLARQASAGICDAIREIVSHSEGFRRVVVILHRQDIPMVAVSFVREEARSGSCGDYDVVDSSYKLGTYVSALDAARTAAERGRLIDIVIQPQHRALFGFYRNPVQAQLGIAPHLNVRLWSGMQLGGEFILPLYNELSDEGDHVRPGLITMNQFARLPGPTFVSITAGTFTNRRYGLDLRARTHVREGMISFGLDIGRTSSISYPNGSVFLEEDPRTTLLARADLLVARYQLIAGVSGGRFLRGDMGARFDFTRQFRGTEIGLFASVTTNGTNAGFHLSVPVFEGAFLGGRRVRVRPREEVSWEYLYRTEEEIAETYDTGTRFDQAVRLHRPGVVMSAPFNSSP